MATLNLSTNGPSISKSYQSVINSPAPTGPAAASSAYGQWALFSISTPLVNAFQQDTGGKESVLKVQSTGEGELVDMIDDFSDGKVQFAFVKVKDPNTSLPKYVLIGWCGEGVPERTKGYFTSHQAAVAKVLHGYHVQVTARSDRDLTPEGIVQKVADASGSRYSGGDTYPSSEAVLPFHTKPAFTPIQSSGSNPSFNPLSRSSRAGLDRQGHVDKDGWGEDAPPVTRTQLEKVQPAYKPTKVNMQELSFQAQEPIRPTNNSADELESSNVIKGTYQPVGKVDIAALRKEAQASGKTSDDRPTVVKGTYEPVGKVDISAIRNRAQKSSGNVSPSLTSAYSATAETSAHGYGDKCSLTDASNAPRISERLTALPKPKVLNKFASDTAASSGTKPLAPSAFGLESKVPSVTPTASASRTFADEGGKTPAQLWAEKKARLAESTGPQHQSSATGPGNLKSPLMKQTSGSGEWKSGYSGKTWAPVQTTKTGQSGTSTDGPSIGGQETQQQEEDDIKSPEGNLSIIRDRFQNAPPVEALTVERSAPQPPIPDNYNKPNATRGIPIPGLSDQRAGQEEEYTRSKMPTPPLQPRSPTPPTPKEGTGSPIRVAMPISRGLPEVEDAHEEQFSPPPPLPISSLAKEVSRQEIIEEDEPEDHDAARAAASTLVPTNFNHETSATPELSQGKNRALIQYDYEKAEDNELELREGEYVTNIEMVDDDWWMGQNSRGEIGLFPSNYVELIEDQKNGLSSEQSPMGYELDAELAPRASSLGGSGVATATALYDYEAAEDNELTFPEGATITNVEFPDEDWWSGEHGGHSGLFPANYVQLSG